MNTTYIILLILVLIYIPTFIFVKKSEWAKSKGLVTSGPMIMIKTQMGIKLMDKLAKYRRFWRFMGILSRFVTLFLMVFIVAILVIDLIAMTRMTSTGGMGIEYALAIPGLNPMLPFVYGWIGLIIAVVVHEFSHGVQTRANDMEVESTGILHAVVPLGAFVEPNEEQVQKCSRRARMDLYAAGITTNFILAMITFLLVFGGVTSGLTTDYGDSPAISGINGGSPAAEIGIPASSIILTIDGNDATSIEYLNDYIDQNHYKDYVIEYRYRDDVRTVSIPLGVYITDVVDGSPAGGTLSSGTFLVSMGEMGKEMTEFGTVSSFTEYMKTTTPNTEYEIRTADKEGTVTTSIITIGERNGIGYLGISTSTGGLTFTTPNITSQYAVDPFHNAETVSQKSLSLLSFIAHALQGYSPVPETCHWWYHSTLVPDNVFWIAMSMLYWIFWLNIVLGVTNAIPAVPFDGGFLFMGGVDWILERTGMKDSEKREAVVDKITRAVSAVMIVTLVLVIVVMII